ncbi:MAG: hypothetical protein IPI59_12205 [Sphingobacteriales bacterium]|jgi:formate hydrogenlyase subunit 3/multisubunit Na+/H+ antiporter MnhD subunit|nr:hypothetical protein [Sphingobacteriales bacterium]MBP9141519.1 hypothetical protein [Chitinophagales bacterium]MDA0199363.1 hypothetical protein [Bacteroidota bacterium]MBK6889204.1 hypothetical protein [Sphingobacteriales bacterium]MBK7528290.1 hypothetical protein [Sphingobacteriales bacterium]
MNQTHIHLLITHLPIFGSFLGAFVLLQALLTKSNQTKIAAYNIFIISAIGAGIAYLTGEAAEEVVENIQGITKNVVEEHEDFAKFTLASLIVLGVASVAGLFLTLKKSVLTRTTALVVLFIALVSFGLVARTGYLGGQIRHTEINNPTATTAQGHSEESEHSEDKD